MGNRSSAVPQQPVGLDMETQQTLAMLQATLKGKNRITDECFNHCVHDFTTRKIIDSESQCSKNCVDKWLKMTQRMSETFTGAYMSQQT